MQTIELHDLLTIEALKTTGATAALTVSGMSVDVGQGENNNSVLKAHAAVERTTGRRLPVDFHLDKRIPPGAGLGGASSDAAAALVGLKAMFKLDIDLDVVAAEIGSDVPFFLHGGAAIVEGRGEHVHPTPTTPSWFAIAWPGIELSTRAVYQAWDRWVQVKGEGLDRAAEHVEPRLKDFARSLGANWRMTGSGSAFFQALASEEEARHAVRSLECWTAVSPALQ